VLVIRDGICYVDSEYLTRYALPSTVRCDKEVYGDGEYAKFIDPITALYFASREDTINYDEVCSLSEEGLVMMINDLKKTLDVLAQRWLESNEIRRQALAKNEHYMRTYKDTKYRYDELVYYKDNRELVDNSITLVINNRQKVLNNLTR